MVCADQQIRSEELKALQQLATQNLVGNKTIVEMEKILAQDENQLSIEEIAQNIPASQQNDAMWQILTMAHLDGFCSALERQMAQQVAKYWSWPDGEVEQQIELVGAFADTRLIEAAPDGQQLSLEARLLQKADALLPPTFIEMLAQVSGREKKIEQLRREIILSGPEYDEAIRQCTIIAEEDYQFTKLALKKALSALNNVNINLQKTSEENKYNNRSNKGQAASAKEVAQQLGVVQKGLGAEIIKEVEKILKLLHSKERTLNNFTIAFMGKTKVGKSTLHAIVTEDGWDAIGSGKQSTTKFNRVYEWKNIRIIDTPGIGAPDGKSEEEIAKSVIDESDVICYVVTNDSIQEIEFNFLRLLKEKIKPLVVLLNVKSNLVDERRLEYFLKNPDRLFEVEGNSGLGGHIERIRRYAKDNYANDYFKVIPVMLLAALLSQSREYEKQKKKLFEASRIQDFLDYIRESLMMYGTIRRSQTLLGSSVSTIAVPQQWIEQQVEVYGTLNNTLKEKCEAVGDNLKKASEDATEYLLQEIKVVFQDVLNIIPSFAEDYWDAEELDLQLGWEGKLREIKFRERLNNAYQESKEKFDLEVREALVAVGNELQLVAQFSGGNFDVSGQNSELFFNNLTKIGESLLKIVAPVLAFSGLLEPIVIEKPGFFGKAINWISGLFKSKDQKRREAVEKISNHLSSRIENYQQVTRENSQIEFAQYCEYINLSIKTYFDDLISGFEVISQELELAKSQLSLAVKYLNYAYAKRIVDWCRGGYEKLTVNSIKATIAKVERNFGSEINIITKSKLTFKKLPKNLKYIIQENVIIKSLKKKEG